MCSAHICQCVLHIFDSMNSGLTQREVAAKLSIHQSNVSDWENDVSRPEYEKLIELAKLYDVSLYDLLGVPDKDRF